MIILRLSLAVITLLFASSSMSLKPAQAQECIASTDAYQLSQDEANALYACIEAEMAANFADVTGVPGVPDYREWELVSTSPLASATHGSMMVNHYVNPLGADMYKEWEGMEGKKFPAGAIFAKESFMVGMDGEVTPSQLFMMEKAAPGTAPKTDDWIYSRVFPDGRIQRTLGPDGARLAFCHDCHAATIDAFDAMFFPPAPYRVATE